MSFKADPPAIRAFGTGVGNLSSDADSAKLYVGQWLGIGYAEARMFATVVEQASSVRQALEENYRHLASLADAAGDQLRDAATHYQETDTDELRRMDSTYVQD